MTTDLPNRLAGSGPKRFRLAVVLLAMFLVLVAGKLWEDALVERLRGDCSSLFADRLLPATTLFHLGDEMHLKQRTLERLVSGSGVDVAEVQYQLGKHDARLEMLTHDIEQTYLVVDESRHLQAFRAALGAYQQAERALLKRRAAGEPVRYDAALDAAFGRVRSELLALTSVQEAVGKQLRDQSVASASSVLSLLYFQLGVAFVLGLLAAGLAVTLGARPAFQRSRPPGNMH
jgi:hypothetical protein